ncbi:hypothetical protein GGP72_001260 [Salinibacter ruber]|uniref:Uncharacterized protein n=1 Tax=Salinibacter ruber TaxID=146919 RepID=A0A9X2PXG6_9BACT|nr:hypothetical protein [Salinibacter ruber]MCS3680631.1 hypothetical protein [Salinibacter ruber]
MNMPTTLIIDPLNTVYNERFLIEMTCKQFYN